MVLFICHGNVARSQFAEALMIEKGYCDVFSAGTNVKPGKEGVALADDGATARNAVKYFFEITGIDISREKRKRISRNFIEKADVIVSMVNENILPYYVLNCRDKLICWEVEDPHDMDLEGYKDIISQIDRNVNQLYDRLRSTGKN